MIDKNSLDKILPLPDIDRLKDEKVKELKEAGFVITNFKTGGIFYTLLMVSLKAYIELITLLRSVINNGFVTHADEDWIEVKALDYGMQRKLAKKTEGLITLERAFGKSSLKIPKNTVFKTAIDINNEELRYFSVKDVVLPEEVLKIEVPIIAEKEGSRYNVPAGLISKSLTYINVDTIQNQENWITVEGSDLEDVEAFRLRVKNAWEEQATLTTAGKYKKAAEAVQGVLFASINDQHPRGQGTVDIIITSTKGDATQQLLDDVKMAITPIIGAYDDVLVKSSVNVQQDIHVKIFVPESPKYDGAGDKVQVALLTFLQISSNRKLNELNLSDIIFTVKDAEPAIRNIKVLSPAADVLLANEKVIIAGAITVDVERVI
ncbi:baseplate J/gp47 family protein [Dielma fastidiosa]|uniref:Baseplate J/gp47 family protein n=1 Tax=Dielma fastidiosa TaxID=1034346 RepID=A0AB35UP99_9FIRM|nr:baseplate J/gp47 family protein [Dielma fastidiosa]MDY5168613.1 baseplate J/gp47 family protein [Dielma fastidiosa]